MTLLFFEGAAGTGKTHNLMAALEEMLEREPLQDRQKVLALTFMNGSVKRLKAKLSRISTLSRKFDCSTFDVFAGRILSRWRTLATRIEPNWKTYVNNRQHNEICHTASRLLENENVAKWVMSAYPVIVIDEAQDLSPERLTIVSTIQPLIKLLIAADEFQHLSSIDGMPPAIQWLSQVTTPQTLTEPKRTNDNGLLSIASSLRAGQPILPLLKKPNEKFETYQLDGFTLIEAAAKDLYAWNLAFQIRRYRGSSILLCPSRECNFTKGVLTRIQTPFPKHSLGPYTAAWEHSAMDKAQSIISQIEWPSIALDITTVEELFQPHGNPSPLKHVIARLKKKQNVTGRLLFQADEIKEMIGEEYNNLIRFSTVKEPKLATMTIHQAKNREFENVIILWTWKLSSDVNLQRRLLYNAITRAKKQCTVIVSGEGRLQSEAIFNDK